MARTRVLLIVVGAVLASITVSYGGSASAVAEQACTDFEITYGLCGAGEIGDGEVIIGGDYEEGGGGEGPGSPGNGGGGPGGGDGDGSNDETDGLVRVGCGSSASCADLVTISDLARFSPHAATLDMEPAGWALIGLPANFVVDAGVHTVPGELFDRDISVRFTPRTYTWNWGDGSSSTSSTSGATWAALGLAEFAETATSHAYAERGSYTISVTVSYAVEFSLSGLPWRQVAGSLEGPPAVGSVVAGTAKTVLVEQECTRNPRGPGC